MSKPVDESIAVFDHGYQRLGLDAQRRYPNEALIQFIAARYFRLAKGDRKSIRILEVGCGSGANLWMLAKEGFSAYGLDSSAKGLALARSYLEETWGVTAQLNEGLFGALPYDAGFFDAVVDVVSLQHVTLDDSRQALQEVARVLKPGGAFFSYRLSDRSVMFQAARNNERSRWLDSATLAEIDDSAMPLAHNGPTSFWSAELTRDMYERAQLHVVTLERVSRTYSTGAFVEYLAINAHT